MASALQNVVACNVTGEIAAIGVLAKRSTCLSVCTLTKHVSGADNCAHRRERNTRRRGEFARERLDQKMRVAEYYRDRHTCTRLATCINNVVTVKIEATTLTTSRFVANAVRSSTHTGHWSL